MKTPWIENYRGEYPPPGEEGRENLVFRGLEADRLEADLKAFGKAGHFQVGGAEERVAGFHPVEVGQEHVLGVLGAAVQFVGCPDNQDVNLQDPSECSGLVQ